MDAIWRASSKCDSGHCLRTALIDGDVRIKDATEAELAFSPQAWTEFVEAVKDGEFDHS